MRVNTYSASLGRHKERIANEFVIGPSGVKSRAQWHATFAVVRSVPTDSISSSILLTFTSIARAALAAKTSEPSTVSNIIREWRGIVGAGLVTRIGVDTSVS